MPKKKTQPVSGYSCLPSGAPAAALNVRMRTLPGTTMRHLGQSHMPEFGEVAQEEMERGTARPLCGVSSAMSPSPALLPQVLPLPQHLLGNSCSWLCSPLAHFPQAFSTLRSDSCTQFLCP